MRNPKSVQAVSKQKGNTAPNCEGKTTRNRFSIAYWRDCVFRPSYTREGQRFNVQQFFVKISHGAVRKNVPLTTNNLDEAARRALKLYQILKRDGWDAALFLFRPDAKPIDKSLTIGKYFALVDEYTPMADRTFASYSYALRRIASNIANAKLRGSSKFNPSGKWRGLVDDIPLAKLTPVAVENWRTRFIKQWRGDPIKERAAIRTTNSYIRNARALFSRNILEAMKKHGIKLPDPLPFSGVRLEGRAGSTRYRSTIDAGALLGAARAELSNSNADAYIIIILGLCAGLRRSEIDHLQWLNIMPEKGIIRIMTTAQKRVKTDESEGDVFCDPGLFSELARCRRSGSTLYVVEPDREFTKTKAAQFYRCNDVFRTVIDWLKAHGVLTRSPLHTLRKEFGSVVASSGDIFQAQRQLRHSQISTTEQYYADGRKRATMPVGLLLNPATKAEGSNG